MPTSFCLTVSISLFLCTIFTSIIFYKKSSCLPIADGQKFMTLQRTSILKYPDVIHSIDRTGKVCGYKTFPEDEARCQAVLQAWNKVITYIIHIHILYIYIYLGNLHFLLTMLVNCKYHV